MLLAPRSVASWLIALVLLPSPSASDAPIIVGRGTAASCTQVTLQPALDIARSSGGGTIRFRCGPSPVVIALTATLIVPDNTAIDGGGLITLDGSDVVPIVSVERNTSVSMKSLTFKHGRSTGDFPAAGAVRNEGRLAIDRGSFVANNGTLDAVIYNTGTLNLKNTVFSENAAPFTIINTGPLVIVNSLFSGNGGGDFSGSVIFAFGLVDALTPVIIENSSFVRNQGPGVVNHSALTVKSSTFSENDGTGIHNADVGTLTVDNSLFVKNAGAEGGGGGITNNGGAIVRNSSFIGNTGSAGAIASYIETLTIENCVLTGNTGGVGEIFNAGDVTIRNSVITGNVGVGAPGVGGVYTCCGGNPPVLVRSVVVGNEPNDIVPH